MRTSLAKDHTSFPDRWLHFLFSINSSYVNDHVSLFALTGSVASNSSFTVATVGKHYSLNICVSIFSLLPRAPPIRGSLPADSAPTVHHEMETLINKQFVSFKRCSVLSSAVTPHAVLPRPAQDVRHCSVQCLRAAHAARPSVTQRPSQSSGRLPWHHRACVQGTLTLLSNGPKHKGREAGDSDVPRRSRKALPLGQKGKVLYLRKEKLVC